MYLRVYHGGYVHLREATLVGMYTSGRLSWWYTRVYNSLRGTTRRVLRPVFGRNGHNEARLKARLWENVGHNEARLKARLGEN